MSDGRRGAESCVAVAVERAVVAVVATKHRADRNRRTTSDGLWARAPECRTGEAQHQRSVSAPFKLSDKRGNKGNQRPA